MLDMQWCGRFSYLFSTLPLGVMGLFLICSISDLQKNQRRMYCLFTLLPMLISLSKLVLMFSEVYSVAPGIERSAQFLRRTLALFNAPLFLTFLLYSCGEPLRRNRAVYAMCAIQGFQLGLLILYQIIGEPYGVDPDGVIRFSPMALFVHLLCFFALVALSVSALARQWKKLSKTRRVFFALLLIVPNSRMILFLPLLLLRDRNRRYLAQKEELVRQKTRVAALQMRSHFIYNTLMSIYYLCKEDVDKAQQVILDFSQYLQANFTAVISESNVPFKSELEHTRAYLAVEKVRYEDKLYVEFDTPVTAFNLPPLTLQPIVENSVKYGISPNLEPLYLSVITRESERGVTITVVDTGPGYVNPDDDEPHVALDNIRQRLKSMCGGTLEIVSRKESGTEVMIFIPWQNS